MTPLFTGGELSLSIEAPPGARALDELPKLDVSKLPGAELVARLGFESADARLVAGCARGPSGRYVPGIEGVLFEKATWFALQGAELAPEQLGLKSTRDEAALRLQLLRGARGRDAITVEHALGFVGPSRDVLLCTTVCVGDAQRCESSRLVVEGRGEPPPEPGLLARSLVAAAEHPTLAVASLGLVGALALGWALAKRPRDP